MEFLNKIEELINKLIYKLIEHVIAFLHKHLPKKIFDLLEKWRAFKIIAKEKIKAFPALAKVWLIKKIGALKELFTSLDLKSKFKASADAAMIKFNEHKGTKKGMFVTFSKILLAPFYLFSQWVRGLSVPQTMLLMVFTGASFLSVIGFIFSGQRLVSHYENSRKPASAEEINYDRPDYYKQDLRHVTVTNFRIPVYVADVNEIRSVDIDIVARISNRNARNFLDKNEFQVRDHIISHTEPSISSFPLEEEGKKIIKEKILYELNDFLKQHGQEGYVEDLKITYILAN